MAISCSLASDLLRTSSCGYQLLQINDIYLANYSDVQSVAVSAGTSGETVTAITMSGSSKWYHIEPTKNSVSYTDDLTVDETNGSKYRTQTLSFNISGAYTETMKSAVDALSLGRYLAVVITADGSALMLGKNVGLEASAQSVAGGSDNNGVSVTLSCDIAESSTPVSNDALETVKGLGA